VDEETTVDDELQRDQQAHEDLLARLRAAAARFDPVPDEAVLAARSQLAHRRLDAELAELVFDSADDVHELAGVRAETRAARQLTFHAGELQIELEILVEGDRRRLVGQCLPSTTVALMVRRRDPSAPSTNAVAAETTTDDLGRFTIEVPAGPVSLRCVWPGTGLAVETTWVEL
jgi:hypothetical protein